MNVTLHSTAGVWEEGLEVIEDTNCFPSVDSDVSVLSQFMCEENDYDATMGI